MGGHGGSKRERQWGPFASLQLQKGVVALCVSHWMALLILNVVQYVVSLYHCMGTLLNPGSAVHQELRSLLQSCSQTSQSLTCTGAHCVPSRMQDFPQHLEVPEAPVWPIECTLAVFLAVLGQGA